MADRFGLQARAALARDRHQADVRDVAQGEQAGAQLGIGIVGADIDIVDHAGHVVDTTGERMARRRGSPVRQMIDQRFRAEPDAAQLGRGGGAIAQADIEQFALGPAILAPQRAVHVAEDARGIAGVTGIEARFRNTSFEITSSLREGSAGSGRRSSAIVSRNSRERSM